MAYQVMTGRFVGRADELARLRELLAHTAGGEPLVALVSGEAGVGKTRLADQVAATAAEQGMLVLRGGCVPLGEEGVPFAPVTEALRGLARALDPDELEAVAGPARAELARLVPDLAWGDRAAVGPAVAGAGQGRLFELLLGVVERLGARGPLVLIMEDLHWADRSTRDELAEQLAGLVGEDPPAGLVGEIYARSEGNPFFAEELVLAGDGAGHGRRHGRGGAARRPARGGRPAGAPPRAGR
jgi:predicted ATPase